MEPRLTESDVALLLMGENDLVTLGAMLSLRVRPEDLDEPSPPATVDQ